MPYRGPQRCRVLLTRVLAGQGGLVGSGWCVDLGFCVVRGWFGMIW